MSIAVSDCLATGAAGRGLNRNQSRFRAPVLLAASSAILSALSACAPTTPTPQETTTTLDVVFDRTGTLVRDGAFVNMTQFVVRIGDTNVPQEALCAFVSLNLNPIPATANVTRVVLNLTAIENTNSPFLDFGAMTVDHVNVVSGIDASDYTGGTITASIATIQPADPTQDDIILNVAIDVTSAVNADRAAGRPISSFRFRFDAAPGPDASTDIVVIEASPDDGAPRPSATVTITQ